MLIHWGQSPNSLIQHGLCLPPSPGLTYDPLPSHNPPATISTGLVTVSHSWVFPLAMGSPLTLLPPPWG